MLMNMMIKMRPFLVLVFAALAGNSALAQNNDTCNYAALGIQPMPDLDLELLYDKRWYVQEIFFRKPEDVEEPSYECLMQYQGSHLYYSDFLLEQYTDLATGVALHNSSLSVQTESEGDLRAVFKVSRDDYREKYTAVWTSTDYESYGVVHWCPWEENPEDARNNYERVVIFTGLPSPDEALLDDLRVKVAVELGFPTDYAVQITHPAGCDYGVCEAVNESCCDPSVVNVPPMQDIDNSRLLNKLWFVQDIYMAEPQPDYAPPSCYGQLLARWDFDIMYLSEVFTPADAEYHDTIDWLAVPGYNGTEQSVWWTMAELYPETFTTVMTHTDHETYGIMHYCPYWENTEYKHERVLTFTRLPIPLESTIEEMHDKVAAMGFPTENRFRIHHHLLCQYCC